MDIRVMVASEVRLYREALQRVLRDAEGIALVDVASSAGEVVERAGQLVPLVLVADLAMAEKLSLEIAEVPADVLACVPSAILGYVSRDGTVAVLLDAIRNAARGEVYRSRQVAAASIGASSDCIDELTVRELEILKLMQQGVSNKTISRELGIELSTVKNHVHSILAKLGVHRRGEAISLLYAHQKAERGWDVIPVMA
jgi:DNA-binding NarL/FixJ family response regulator